MTRGYWLAGAALVLTSTVVLAQRSPESILPPGFDKPAPTPAPTSTPAPAASPAAGAGQGGAVVQPLPGASTASTTNVDPSDVDMSEIPSLDQLEAMSPDELDELFGLKPKFDMPLSARRSTERVGVIGASEGGLPSASLARQPASIVRAALASAKGPLVSRWGHILMRRALASRLNAPEGMKPVEFAALRAAALNAMGEHTAARALVQDVDNAEYSNALTFAAIDSYIGTADIVGACPIVRLDTQKRDGVQWTMLESICRAFAGEATAAQSDLRRLFNRTAEDRIDILLAQRFAGAAGEGRKAVTIEWDGIEDMNPWRFALANALGEPIPDGLVNKLSPYYLKAGAVSPALPVAQRLRGADVAAAAGILSSKAMVDLYSQIFASRQQDGDSAALNVSTRLRDAYVDPDPANRLAAIKDVWDSQTPEYGRLVLTAYAAARLTPSSDFAGDAGPLIASMLAAGLERDALRWSAIVDDGSLGWALLVLANPQPVKVSDGDIDSFAGDDTSDKARKSQMLVAGLAGLDRMDQDSVGEYSGDMGLNLAAPTNWTRMIDKAAAVNNRALVVYLAGLGMQGSDWDAMTARHLYHIVSALKRVGLEAEARMIAAEAVARA